MTGDVTKLPKWAQQRIQTLERNLEHYKKRLEAGPANSRVFADPYSDARRPLGWDTVIQFDLGEEGEWGKKIEVRIDGKGVKVMGGSRLAVFPSAANSIQVRSFR